MNHIEGDVSQSNEYSMPKSQAFQEEAAGPGQVYDGQNVLTQQLDEQGPFVLSQNEPFQITTEPEVVGEKHEVSKKSQKPNSDLGNFLDEFAKKRGMGITKLGKELDLNSIVLLKKRELSSLSLYAFEKILTGIDFFDASEEEIQMAADIVAKAIQERLDKYGKLYDRIPPSVPKRVAASISYEVYTPTQLAKKVLNSDTFDLNVSRLATRISMQAKVLGFSTLLTGDQAEGVIEKIKKLDARKEETKKIKSEFGKRLERYGATKDQLSQANWLNKEKGYPNDEEFGALLASINLSDNEREEVIEIWLQNFRENLPLTNERITNEFGVTRQYLNYLGHKLDPANTLSNWGKIERMREYRLQSEKTGQQSGLRKNHPVPRQVTASSLARELNVSRSTTARWAKRLNVQDIKYLTPNDVDNIRNLGENPPRGGRPVSGSGTLAGLAREFNIPEQTIYYWARRLDIQDRRRLTSDDIDRLRKYSKNHKRYSRA